MAKLDPHLPRTGDDGTADGYLEKRNHPRRQIGVRCWIGDGSHTVYLRLYDLSRGGLSVRAPVPFHTNGELDLSIELPDRGRVRARGRVVWVRNGSQVVEERGPRMGARFVEFLEGEEDLCRLLTAA